MDNNHDDLNYRSGNLNEEEGAAKFNPDAQKHAIEAMEEDEVARIKQSPAEGDDEDEAMDAYGL
ncbi:hypothetical protein [Mucilaginibacter defluvii]|uniref:Uncharacterized protein n=1 Tax=Mucilaginibacter defluvii TaxID=1196019 RepID=A0ABP9G5R9_9SPHI